MARTYLPDRVVIEPNLNYDMPIMTPEECRYWNIPVIWAGKKLNLLRYETILFNLKKHG